MNSLPRAGLAPSLDASAPLPPAAYAVELCPLNRLRPSEAVDDRAVQHLVDRMVAQGVWTTPIPVDAPSGLVMDGNHRLRAAGALLPYKTTRHRFTPALPTTAVALAVLRAPTGAG